MHGVPAVTGLVLCGGKSSRMGRDKARLTLGGGTLVERALTVLEPLVSESLLACGSTPRYTDLGHRQVLDEITDGGPLAGLVAGLGALAESGGEWLIALACDMPRVDTALLRALLQRAVAEDLDGCVFTSERGVEPLCAVYRKTCLIPARAALSAGERRMVAFWPQRESPAGDEVLRIGRLSSDERPSDALRSDPTVNLNTPEELARERANLGERT